MKRSFIFAGVVCAAGLMFAQAEPGSVEQLAETDSTIVVGEDVATQLQEFLDAKGWTEGDNYKKDGSLFIVVTGVGTIAAPPSSNNYNASRANAFAKAMLDAKAALSGYLEQTIATSVEAAYAEQGAGSTKAEDDVEIDTAKATAAIDALPADSVVGQTRDGLKAARAKNPTATETFSRSVASSTKALISGLQAFYTVEAQAAGQNGEIGVVAIWSPALAETAACMVNGKTPVALRSAKKPIKQQIPTDKEKLLSTFGVQQKIDENGELVLVAFAQSAARSNNTRAKNAAYDKAEEDAKGMIRAFAGEAIEGNSALAEAEQTEDFNVEGEFPDYSDEGSYFEYQRSVGAELTINGAKRVNRWHATHPVSGKEVYGVILAWSPTAAKVARAAKAQIESTAKDGTEGRRTNMSTSTQTSASKAAAKPAPAPTMDEFYNAGDSGDDDAF